MARAIGHFDVQMKPLSSDELPQGITRMSLDKQFRGDLTGTGHGEMLTTMGHVEGSAGYVATERVSGTVGGCSGEFVLQHFGILDRGKPTLEVRVVPDSGTGALEGLRGTMTIDAENDHAYVFDYDLPRQPAGA